MKKQIAIIVLLLITIKAFTQTIHRFNIIGHIANLNTGTVYFMYTPHVGKTQKDSCKIINGNFSFKGGFSEPDIAFFRLDNTNYVNKDALYIFLSPGTLVVELSNNPFQMISIKGSKNNDDLMEWKNADIALKKEFNNVLQRNSSDGNDAQKKAYEDSTILYNQQKYLQTYRFAQSHLQSYFTPYLLNSCYQDYTAEQVQDIYNFLSDSIKNSVSGKKLLKHIQQMQANSKGVMAANIVGEDYINNEGFNLLHLKGKYVMIDFWGSWCKPCIELLPDLVKEHQAYINKNVAFVSVAVDEDGNKDKCREIAKSMSMSWPNIWQTMGKNDAGNIVTIFNIRAYPTFILIDPSGKIIEKGTGENGYFTCKALLQKLL